MTVVVFDIYISGHHVEYIRHLLTRIAECPDGNDYVFVVHPELLARFPDLATYSEISGIEFMPVSISTYRRVIGAPIIRRSFVLFKLAKDYCEKVCAQRIIFLHLNHLQLALIFHKPALQVEGILLGPYTRASRDDLKSRLVNCRKHFQTWCLVQRGSIQKAYLLNDKVSCRFLNIVFHTGIFRYLPDPLPNLHVKDKINIRERFDIESHRRIYLHFGSLSIRKGTLDILDAIEMLSDKVIGTTAFIFAGRTDSSVLNDTIKNSIAEMSIKCRNARIVFIDEFVGDDLKNALFLQSDVVLIPYRNVESSSGILAHAIAAKKPVIGPKKGLLGSLIEQNAMGITISGRQPSNEIATLISQNEVRDVHVDDKIYTSYSQKNFVDTLLGR